MTCYTEGQSERAVKVTRADVPSKPQAGALRAMATAPFVLRIKERPGHFVDIWTSTWTETTQRTLATMARRGWCRFVTEKRCEITALGTRALARYDALPAEEDT